MAHTTLYQGITGQNVSVKQLQKALIDKGYGSLLGKSGADGKFGSNTAAAVRKYQMDNNLSDDSYGTAGNQTWASLLGESYTKAKSAAESLVDIDATKPAYADSAELAAAKEALTGYQNQKPGAYTSQYADDIKAAIDAINNRKDFSYDFSSDPLYQQYANQYQQQGRMAMMDTMGQAAALTGGYGSSYANAVGQQAYQQSLQQMQDILPELQQAAYSKYVDEEAQMQQKLSDYEGLEESDRNLHSADLNDYYNQLNALTGDVERKSSNDWDQFMARLNSWENDRNYWANQEAEETAQAMAATTRSGSGRNPKPKPTNPGNPYNDLSALIENGVITTVGVIDSAKRAGHITEDEYEMLEKKIRQKTTKPSTPPENMSTILKG